MSGEDRVSNFGFSIFLDVRPVVFGSSLADVRGGQGFELWAFDFLCSVRL